VAPSIIARMLVVVGIVLGVFCVGAVSIVLGALFGTAVGYVTDLISAPAKARETAEAKQK
jgi:Na+/H+-translocating membrane pyrophosphatase